LRQAYQTAGHGSKLRSISAALLGSSDCFERAEMCVKPRVNHCTPEARGRLDNERTQVRLQQTN
jgi:hypothetical protein